MKILLRSNLSEEEVNRNFETVDIEKELLDSINYVDQHLKDEDVTVHESLTASDSVDKRLSFTSTKYKGYRISLDHKNNCYNIYDKHGELEDSGFTSQLAAKEAIDLLVESSKVNSSKVYNVPKECIKDVYYPDGALVSERDMNKYLDYNFGTDRDRDLSSYTTDEMQRSVDYWFKKHEPYLGASTKAEENVEYLDDEDTLQEFIDELAENGVDIYDDQDILQELGANYGYDKEDQLSILKDIRDYVGQGINSAEDVDYTTETDGDFDTRWNDRFGEPSTEVFDLDTVDEFENWWKEVISFE